MVIDTDERDASEAQAYLDALVPDSMAETKWLQTVAAHVPKMRRWWRCVSAALTDTPAAQQTRRGGLSFMLEAAVHAQHEDELSSIVAALREWSCDWNDKESQLKTAMTQ